MKLAMLIAQGFEISEALVTLDVLRRANITTDLISIDTHINKTSSHHVTLTCDYLLEDVNMETYSGIILPGGMPGTAHLEENDNVIYWLNQFNKQGKYLFAICAAPSILVKLGFLDHQSYTCYPGFHEKDSKAHYLDKEKVVVSNRIITAKAMGASLDFGLKIIEKLLNIEEAEKVKKSVFY
ncbi:MAG: DJ-1 family glyoxalase III [Erysipelotrichaceae bacterium]